MSIEKTILKINTELISTFAQIDSWFDHHEQVLAKKPAGQWSPAEILEHVMLTNHYLLLLIEKGCRKAMNKARNTDLREAVMHYEFDIGELEKIATPGLFQWERPDHMAPNGQKSLKEIREKLREQLYDALLTLDMLRKGEGILHRISLSINGLGKLDVYQYMYFLVLHMKRHLRQLEKTSVLQ